MGLADMAGIRRGQRGRIRHGGNGTADRTNVVVVEPSGTVPAGELTDSIRSASWTSAAWLVDDVVLAARRDRHADNERQGAASSNEDELRARRRGTAAAGSSGAQA